MKTKYPILLVHGIIIKDFLFIKSFGKIDKYLKKEGYIVYKAKNDGFGSIENNAKIIKENIEEILKKENCKKVNIIAHSKGGLDSKYLITNLKMGSKVASLTTLCTPFKGSPVATKITKLPNWMLKFVAFWINLWYRIFGDKHPDSLKVVHQLSEAESVENETFKISNKIYCQSYSTTIDAEKSSFIDNIPNVFYHLFAKDDTKNDGLVSKDSAKFGEFKDDAFNDNIWHSQMTDFMTGKKKKERVYGFYKKICEDLAKRGL